MRLENASKLVSLGRPSPVPGAPVNSPIVLSSTYHANGEIAYGRESNPAWESIEEIVGDLEGGLATLFASGMAAIAAVIETLDAGAKVVVIEDSYNGTRHFLDDLSSRGRIVVQNVNGLDLPSVESALDGASMLWIESPTNPLVSVLDIGKLVELAKSGSGEVLVVADNTFATPLLQQPLSFGVDVVVHSATKYLSGHSDVIGGIVVTADEPLHRRIVERRMLHGAVMGPLEAFLLLRGLRTLDVRLERSQENAGFLASKLAEDARVARVRYPGLASDPGHKLASEQMSGFGAIVSFEVGPLIALGEVREGSSEWVAAETEADRVCEAVRLCTFGTSLGGVETLLERRRRWAWEQMTPPGLIRLSVGIEDAHDLWSDLDAALGQSVGKK